MFEFLWGNASILLVDEEVQIMLDKGVIDFIQKPFTMETLSKNYELNG